MISEYEDLPDEIWQLGVFDAHCHPTDNYSKLESGLGLVKSSKLTIMATRLDDQDKVHSAAVSFPGRIVPCFGYHPWFTHIFYTSDLLLSKSDHYNAVLIPAAPSDFIDKLPDPVCWNDVIGALRSNLERHPDALVGEVGLDRSFRLPLSGQPISYDEESHHDPDQRVLSQYKVSLDHQTEVLLAQLKLAAEYGRAVSVHGVQAHGVLYSVLSSLWKDYKPLSRRQRKLGSDLIPISHTFPPRICLHSYSGPPDQIKLWTDVKKVPAQIYFSFSILINTRYGEKFKSVIRAVPDDRILVETDFPIADQAMHSLMAGIVRFVCDVKGWDLSRGVTILNQNWHKFVYGMT
ncbi:hypothetical protein V1512DRAFT_31910 [Lipomyces arxii]|uniref:uncharacterized protein n=1 Tax=Lipomyces arxii TaxID=56418 RepID=UPI0034CDC944